MQSDRWQDCADIFNAAIERPLNARAALLDRSCHGDAALRRQVELLLKYHDQSGDFIDAPAFVVAPELLIADPNALIGRHLGNYRIDAVLGVGGMGVVYLAFDERLGRKVGLKLLPPSLVVEEARWERLKHEARAASALNHPNIMTIHEFGEVDSTHYIATEFIEGITLRERTITRPISPDEAVNIAIQVASALCVAHNAGIVHRDIKPENIMLRPDGYVKVLDFGIAKFTDEDTLPGPNHGMIRGTVRYMSPEQARGEALDLRSDLWSLGVVCYEMLAGRPPFEGKTPTDVMAAVLQKEPVALEQCAALAPPALRTVVKRSLRKDPAERYQTAEEMLFALRAIAEKSDGIAATSERGRSSNRAAQITRWAGVAAGAILLLFLAVFYGWRNGHSGWADPQTRSEKGIAVLPFENLSAEKEDAFFTEGIQDDVLTSVGKIKHLKVIARASVLDYRGARLAGKVREIGNTLGVSHVLEGSVRRMGDRVVINVALIDARDERQVWSERYERTLIDTISLQGELAIEIARALQATLTPAEATVAAAKPTQNPQAYLLYLRARETEIANGFSNELQPTIQLYQQAVDLDPKFALARARLSLCASRLFYSGSGSEWKARARVEAEEALRLQPQLGEARLALTHCFLWGDKDYNRALVELAQAAELLPNSAEVPLTAAFIYKRQNRYRDRFTALYRAEALDPRNHRVLGYLAATYRWVRDWPEALQASARVCALAPQESAPSEWWARANDEFSLNGNINTLKNAITGVEKGPAPVRSDWLNVARYETAMLERDFSGAARFLATVPAETFDEAVAAGTGHLKVFHEALLAVAAESDATVRQQTLERARMETETRIASRSNETADSRTHVDLALLYAFLDRKEEALRKAIRVVELAAQAGTIENNDFSSALAMVYAQIGEPEKAIDLVERLLTLPTDLQRGAVYNMTLTDLKWRWQWDPLRSHPRFQKILAGSEPKTVY